LKSQRFQVQFDELFDPLEIMAGVHKISD